MLSLLTTLYNTLLESAPYVVIGFLIAGVIRFWVPRDILQRHIGRPIPSALFKSVGVGTLLPICSCGTIPLGIGMYRNGATVGNMLAFMTSTPVLSPVLIAISIKLLGVTLTSTLVISTVVGALLLGVVGNRVFRGAEPINGGSCSQQRAFSPEGENTKKRDPLYETIRWSLFDLGASVSVDILLGLTIAAVLLSFLPLDWISMWLGQQDLFTLLYVIILGIPVYACSIPSVAIVQSLLLLGASPGAAIAYMISGPATNLGELNAIRKSMGPKPMTFYIIALVSMALLAGFVTDTFIFPDYQYHAFRVNGELIIDQCCVPMIFGEDVTPISSLSQVPDWHIPFGVVLLIILLYGLYTKIKYFFINPCAKCIFKEYAQHKGTCAQRCHVRRKYDFVRRWWR